jgi:hypothetical protein
MCCGWLQLQELKPYMEKLKVILLKYKIKCTCGNILNPQDLTFSVNYGEYWIYANCPKCDYDYNYEKIIKQFNSLKSYKDDEYSF